MSDQVRYFKCVEGSVAGTSVGDIRKVWWCDIDQQWCMEDPLYFDLPWRFNIDKQEISGCRCYLEEIVYSSEQEHQEGPMKPKKLTPRSLRCFQQVVDVIGEESAEDELQKVIDDPEDLIGNDSDQDRTDWTFVFSETVQGIDFWSSIMAGEIPEGFTPKGRTEHHHILTNGSKSEEPDFGDVVHVNGNPRVYLRVCGYNSHIIASQDGQTHIVRFDEIDEYKPDEHQEQRQRILQRWQRKNLDNAHDTLVCIAEMRLDRLIDFVQENILAES